MKINCPTCQAEIEWSSAHPYRPFCSKRCQLIDLGEWAGEENRITDNAKPTDLPIDIEEIEALLAEQEKGFFK